MKPSLPRLGLAGLLLLATGAALAAGMPRTPSPVDAKVYFIEPQDGATVGKTFTVKFGLDGMNVAPAGSAAPNSGHHHLLIDLKEQPSMDVPLPANDNIRHFGKGQTETQLTLPPGKHTLQLLLGDRNHVPFDPPVESKPITVNVQ